MCKASTEKMTPAIKAIPAACADEAKAMEFMEKMRWGDSPYCPHCNSVEVYQMKSASGERNKRFLWRCKDCKKQFTVRIGTVMQESRVALRHWCYALWRSMSSKKGVSALEIKRQTGVAYRTALFMLNRIRHAMEPEPLGDDDKLKGTVEADETWIGGKPRYRGQSKRGRGTKKQPVAVLVERGGRVRAYTVPKVNSETLQGPIRELVDPSARIMTDENRSYRHLGFDFKSHEVIRHKYRQYVRGDVHTNTAESFNALVKRGLHGIYHSVSKRHLHRYLAEFMFRYDHRYENDGQRLAALIQAMIGKRLMYKRPVPKAS